MVIIYDNIVAIIVAASVMLVLVSIRQRTAEVNIEQMSMYVAKEQAFDFAEWLEDDLEQLGARLDTAEAWFEMPVPEGPHTGQFTFYQDSLNYAASPVDTIRVETRYVLAAADTVALADSMVVLYQVERSLRKRYDTGWTAWAVSGASPARLSAFTITPMAADGQVAATEGETDLLRVAFSMVSPYRGQRHYLHRISWASTIDFGMY